MQVEMGDEEGGLEQFETDMANHPWKERKDHARR